MCCTHTTRFFQLLTYMDQIYHNLFGHVNKRKFVDGISFYTSVVSVTGATMAGKRTQESAARKAIILRITNKKLPLLFRKCCNRCGFQPDKQYNYYITIYVYTVKGMYDATSLIVCMFSFFALCFSQCPSSASQCISVTRGTVF